MDPVPLADPDDLVLNVDELMNTSDAPKDTGALCDASCGCPTAPS